MPTPYPGQGAPLSAKLAKARFNGNVLFQTTWNIKPESYLLDTSNPEEGGYENQIPGLSKCEISVSGWWNGAANMHQAPLNIVDGAILPNCFFYVYDLTGPFWNAPFVTIKGPPMTTEMHDLVKYTFDCKVNGVFFYPSGSVVPFYFP